MNTVKGDLIALAKAGQFDVIVHGCNCFCTMGSGVARAIRQTFPAVYEADRKTKKGDINKLGTCEYIHCSIPGSEVTVVNAYTQYNFGKTKRQYVDYDAVRKCFKCIKENCSSYRIGFPLIGAGLGGGDWNIISKIIEEELEGEDYTLVVLP